MIVFLSCGKTKASKKCYAKDMYKGELFKKSYAYAKTLNPGIIYILSAKYGLLKENDIISPYEKTLNKMKKQEVIDWNKNVIKALQNEGVKFTEKAFFLCGESYRKYLVKLFKDIEIPIKGLSFGNQLKFYKERNK